MPLPFQPKPVLILPIPERWQAESAYLAGYIPKWFTFPKTVTHSITHRARCLLTLLIRPTSLTTTPRCRTSIKQRRLPSASPSKRIADATKIKKLLKRTSCMSSMQLVSCLKWLCCRDDSSGTGTMMLSMLVGGGILLGSFISSGFPLPPSSVISRFLQSAFLGILARLSAIVPQPGSHWSKTQRSNSTRCVAKLNGATHFSSL